MFSRDSEDTQESLYMNFQASGVKPRGGETVTKQILRGLGPIL